MKRKIFYILSFTWGLPLTVCGCAVALFLMARGHRPRRFGACWYFIIGKKYWGGFSLGPVFVTDKTDLYHNKCHEHGHGLQNCVLGPLILPLVLLSIARYHDRNRRARRGEVLPPYDAWWFEGHATELGRRYVGGKEG